MSEVTIIGIDLVKRDFQLHGAFTHFGGILVRCLAHDAPSCSGVGVEPPANPARFRSSSVRSRAGPHHRPLIATPIVAATDSSDSCHSSSITGL